jgi:hypothetical protein
MMGHKMRLADNPPTITERPWNSLTFQSIRVTTQDNEEINVTIGGIVDYVRSKLGIAETNNRLLIKVKTAAIWCTAANLTYPDVECMFYELSGEAQAADQGARSTQRDQGTLNKPAKCGYQYPTTDSKDILGANTDQLSLVVMKGKASEQGSHLVFRAQILWQSSP